MLLCQVITFSESFICHCFDDYIFKKGGGGKKNVLCNRNHVIVHKTFLNNCLDKISPFAILMQYDHLDVLV